MVAVFLFANPSSFVVYSNMIRVWAMNYKPSMIFILPMLLLSIAAANAFAQSTRQSPVAAKKANARPAETPPKNNVTRKNETGDDDDAAESDDDILTVDTNLVTLPVRVLDRQGRFLSGLKKEDFTVFEDKRIQKIEHFTNEESPFTVALVLDMSYSSKFKINEIQQAALTFITELRPADKVMVIAFDQDPQILCEPTSDRKVLEQAIVRTRIGSGTSLYETVDFVINKRLSLIGGRKAIVLFTDGVDTTSREADDRNNLDDALELDALVYPIRYDTYADVRAIEDGRVVIQDPAVQTTPPIGGGTIPTTDRGTPFPILLPTGSIGTSTAARSLPGSGTTKEEYDKAEAYLSEMAMRTGGRVYSANDTGRLANAFSQIAGELREFYGLAYYPDNENGAARRRLIKVKVNRKKVAVKTRDSYVVGEKRSQ